MGKGRGGDAQRWSLISAQSAEVPASCLCECLLEARQHHKGELVAGQSVVLGAAGAQVEENAGATICQSHVGRQRS